MTSTTPRVGRTAAALVAALALVLLTAAPAPAANRLDEERSPRVRVTKGPLLPSEDLGTAKDREIGEIAPTLKGLSLTGKALTVANDGKPRIVLFLSHSCPHCQAEVPEIVKLAKQGKLDGVEVDTVTTNTSKSLPNWPPSKWLKREHWPFHPVLADDARLRGFIGYGGQAFPYFVFVGADGKVVARAAGELPPGTLSKAAQKLASGESFFSSQQ
jgi:thiol-disulfide isomerase/thioredoxin